MKNVIELLYTLQTLEMGPTGGSSATAPEIQRLRELIPPQIIGHYDRLRTRNKKGVSVVRNSVCTECHMRLAIGVYAELLRSEDIKICDSCGRYLIIPKEQPVVEGQSKPDEKTPVKKRRKKRAASVG